uniref:Cilia- and flagella-associated protein 43 n=1 Tax=Eptatretus burgeri TaxID=7764 RepID=A0A8C4QYY8_EPTBU
MEDGKPIGCSSLGEQVSSLASSRCCQQVVIGTNSGFLYFLNCVNPERPRVVHHEKLFKVPVTFLQFDLDGQVLLAGASLDNRVFVVDGRPSRKFSVVGFMPVTSLLLGVSLLTENSLSWVLLLQSTSEAVSTKGGSQLTRLCLPSSILNDNCANMYGAINEHLLQRCVYELDVPATCAVLGPQSKVYTSFEYGGDIYVYQLPQVRTSYLQLNVGV